MPTNICHRGWEIIDHVCETFGLGAAQKCTHNLSSFPFFFATCCTNRVECRYQNVAEWNLTFRNRHRYSRERAHQSSILIFSHPQDLEWCTSMYIMHSDLCLQARQDCQTPRPNAMDHQRSCLRSLLSRGDALEKQYVKRVPIDQLSPINQLFLVSLCK